jgi:titin
VRAVETVHFLVTTTTASDWSAAVSSWVLAAPVGAVVQHVEDSRDIRIRWTSLDPLATGYEILRSTNPLMRASVIHEGPHTDTFWVNTGLDPNKNYYYYVRAWKTGTESTDRDVSGMSPMLSITTVPEVPTAQVAYSSGRTITVSWAHSGNCSQFHVWSKPTRVTDPVMPDMLPATQRSKAIVDAEYGRWYVLIRAWGEGGYSPEKSALDVWVLTVPSAPLATVGGSTTVNLSWGAPDANATSVRILRSVSAGPFADLATVASAVTTYADTTCLSGTTYTYKLQAVRDDDVSELSPSSASVTTPAALTPPATPTGLTAVAQSSAAVGLTWSDNASNEESYRVYRRDGTAVVFGQVSPDLPAGTTGWQDTSVAASSLYTYAVKARNAAGDSGWSNEAAVTTPAAPVPVPAAPTNLVAAAESWSVVKLTWTDNATNEGAYLLERAVGVGAFAPAGPELSAGTTEWRDTGAAGSTSYRYRVKARNAGGDSGWSNEASVTTPSAVQSIVMKLIIDKKNYTVNGVSMMMDIAPVILESRTLGPVRYVAEALGAGVAWDPVERKVTLTRGITTIELWIGRNTARVDGAYMLIDPQNPEVKPVILPPGRTMLPFRFIAEQLGASVGWDAVKREVTITYPAS